MKKLTTTAKSSQGILAAAAIAAAFTLAIPASAACIGGLIDVYLREQAQAPRGAAHVKQLAIVKIVAVHPDVAGSKPAAPKMMMYSSTGTLDLQKIDADGQGLPSRFTVAYEQRTEPFYDCESFDRIPLKRGVILVAFVQPATGKAGWSILQGPYADSVQDLSKMDPKQKAKVQVCFKTLLSSLRSAE